MMQTYPPRTEKEAVAVTSVWWDINRCPVPADVDARLIGPFIKRSLKKLGYSGRVTITAIGILTEVDNDVLQALWSTGVSLHHVPTKGLVSPLSVLLEDYPPPANLMGISREGFLDGYLEGLSSRKYNILASLYPERPISIFSDSTRFEGCYLWDTFLADIGFTRSELSSNLKTSLANIRLPTPGFIRSEVSSNLKTSLANIRSPKPGVVSSLANIRSPTPGFTRSEVSSNLKTSLANIRSPTPVRPSTLFCGSCKLGFIGSLGFANHLCSKEHALKDLYYQPFGGAVAATADDTEEMDADAIRAVLKRIRETPNKPSSSEYLIEYEGED